MRKRRRCLHCAYSSYCLQHSYIQLVSKERLRECMWLNPHIHSAYRPPDLPWRLCIRSIFQWNNETLNVWSHLLGFLSLAGVQYWSVAHALPAVNAHPADYVVMSAAMMCSQICMVLSSAYHIFGCRSARSRRRWLQADLLGIAIGLLGIYLSGIYTSFYFFPQVQRFYIGTLGVVLAITLYLPFNTAADNNHSRHHHNNKSRSGKTILINGGDGDGDAITDGGGQQLAAERCTHERPRRRRRVGAVHMVYVALALYALYPTWHWIELHGGIQHPHVMAWLPTLAVLFALVALAFLFYATLIPERFFPGRFDVVGCSHQWWHLLIVAAMLYWHCAGVQLLTHYHTDYVHHRRYVPTPPDSNATTIE